MKTKNSPITIGSSSTSTVLKFTGFGLIVVPITAGVGCGVAIGTNLPNEYIFFKKEIFI